MSKNYLILVLSLFVTSQMFAQTLPDVISYDDLKWEMVEGKNYVLDVNGVELWDTLSKEDFIKKFGVPTKIHNEDGALDWPGEPKHRMYYYDDSYFETYDGEFNSFYIKSPEYKVLTKYFKAGIGVGDHISALKDFKDGVLCLRKKNEYLLQSISEGFFTLRTDDQGHIVSIDYNFPM